MGLDYPCTLPRVLTEELLLSLGRLFPYLTKETQDAVCRDLCSHGTESSITISAPPPAEEKGVPDALD